MKIAAATFLVMDSADEIEFTVRTFQKVLSVEKHRLATGAILRRYIHEKLADGIEPDHYRMRWMNKGVSRFISELEEFGREFNSENPTDKFSTADMIDIAQAVVLTLTEYVQRED